MTTQRHLSSLLAGLLCVTVLVLAGCQGKVEPKLTLKPGDSRTLRIKNDLTQKVTVMGQEQGGRQSSATSLVLEVESVEPSGKATVKATYKEGGVPDMAGAGPMAEQMGDLSSLSLEGKTFTMTIEPDGAVGSVEGMNKIADEFAEKAFEITMKMSESNPMLAQAMGGQQSEQIMNTIKETTRKMIREEMGDEAIREQMEALFSIYPDVPIAAGDQWTKTQILYKGKPMVLNDTYTLKERKDGALFIDVASEITANDSAKPIEMMPGMQMKMTFSGQQSGNLKIDEATGWLLSGTFTRKIEGTMDMSPMSMSMPITIEGTVSIESE